MEASTRTNIHRPTSQWTKDSTWARIWCRLWLGEDSWETTLSVWTWGFLRKEFLGSYTLLLKPEKTVMSSLIYKYNNRGDTFWAASISLDKCQWRCWLKQWHHCLLCSQSLCITRFTIQPCFLYGQITTPFRKTSLATNSQKKNKDVEWRRDKLLLVSDCCSSSKCVTLDWILSFAVWECSVSPIRAFFSAPRPVSLLYFS